MHFENDDAGVLTMIGLSVLLLYRLNKGGTNLKNTRTYASKSSRSISTSEDTAFRYPSKSSAAALM